MAKDGVVKAVKVKKKAVKVVDSSIMVAIGGKMNRPKRETAKESNANSGEAVNGSVGRAKRKSKDETVSRKKKRKDKDIVEALDEEVSLSGIGEEIEIAADRVEEWLTEYRDRRPGFEILQQRIDDFIIAHEGKLEQERKEREAHIAEDGWTVVEHHKGRKKLTDGESRAAVGSVSQAAVQDKLTKKKQNGIGPDFYRFQKHEAQRNELMMLQSKFEEDRQQIQQLRAARKFRPY